MIGVTLAHYRITGELGSGGMGEVWRAEDEKLGREVALKILPAEFAEDEQRFERFQREARVLASLNHPNVAHLYGLETASPCHPERAERVEGSPDAQSDDNKYASPQPSGAPSTRSSDSETDSSPQAPTPSGPLTFLVMELVEGEDLSEKTTRGSLPSSEVIPIALQIAQALEAAHDQGIVHRDLKPANIKLKPDGTVKVLDFGLAKAWEVDSTDASLSLSPTMTQHATAAGLILGTAAYMSPEQARGQSVDRRADIWAFGVVVWEMLTGRKLFEGDTVSDVLASVLKEAPSLDALPPDTPRFLRRLVGRCLDKDSKTRLRDIGEARIALTRREEDARTADVVSDVGRGRPVASSTAVAGGADSRPWWPSPSRSSCSAGPCPCSRSFASRPRRRRMARFHLAPDNPGPVAVSPDGTRCWPTPVGRPMASFSCGCGRWTRPRRGRLPSTENAQYPFWSPDSRRIGFFSNGKLRVIEAVGGPPLALCDTGDGKGGSWGSNGVIVFSPSYNTPIHQVAEAGGESDRSHRVQRRAQRQLPPPPQISSGWKPLLLHGALGLRVGRGARGHGRLARRFG